MYFCSKCGSKVPENARFCPACAAPVQSNALAGEPVTSRKKRSLASALGYWIGRHPIWTILLLILFLGYVGTSVLREHREPAQQSPDGKTQPAQGGVSNVDTSPKAQKAREVESQLSPADRFALNLERKFKENGYDIDASVGIDKSLVLTSDIFKDASARETEASELWKDRNTLCGLDIWYVKVGYSKGIFSSDVMKTLSLGCPAEKAARPQEMSAEREKAATTLSVEG